MEQSRIYIANLAEFRRDLRSALARAPRELTAGLKRAGEPLVLDTARRVPVRTGRLMRGYRVRARATKAWMTSLAPYGAGAEWGRYGKWKGFLRYGPPGRFGARTLEAKSDEIVSAIYRELREVFEILGWAREV